MMRTTTKERFTFRQLDATERPRKFYEYWVTGSGEFPIDMLRHDRCWPATGVDADKINSHREREMRSIKMWSHHEPTIGRWSSFNWSVGTEKMYPRD